MQGVSLVVAALKRDEPDALLPDGTGAMDFVVPLRSGPKKIGDLTADDLFELAQMFEDAGTRATAEMDQINAERRERELRKRG